MYTAVTEGYPKEDRDNLLVPLVICAGLQWAITGFLWSFSAGGELGAPLTPILARTIMALGACILTALAAIVWHTPHTSRVHQTVEKFQAIAPLLVTRVIGVGLWLLAVPFFLGSFWFGNTLVAIQLMLGGLWLILLTEHRRPLNEDRLFSLGPAVVIILSLIVRLGFVFWGQVNVDEGSYIDVSRNIADGYGIWQRYLFLGDSGGVRPPWGYAVGLYGIWARIFGSTLISLRLMNYVVGTAALPFVYGAVYLWHGKRQAAVATSFVAASALFAQSANARNDALPLLFLSMALYAHVLAESKHTPFHYFLAGMVTILALEAHIYVAIFILGVVLYYITRLIRLARFKRQILPRSNIWWTGAGAVIALVIYGYLHLFHHMTPERYFAALLPFVPSGHPLVFRATYLFDRFINFWIASPVEGILVIASVIAAFRSKSPFDRHWLILFLSAILGWYITGASGSIHYTMVGLPLYLAGSGSLFANEKPYQPVRPVKKVAYLAFSVIGVGYILGLAVLFARFANNDWKLREPLIAFIQENIPDDEAVIANPMFISYLPEYETFIIPSTNDVLTAPIMFEMDPDLYWLNKLIEIWPRVYIETPPDLIDQTDDLPVFISYSKATGASEALDGLWIVPDTLVTDAPYVVPDTSIPLQMVGHHTLPVRTRPGQSIDLSTIWVVREALIRPPLVEFALLSESGEPAHVWRTSLPAEAYLFHNLSLLFPVPRNLPEGRYTIQVSVLDDDSLCEPQCSFTIAALTVSGE